MAITIPDLVLPAQPERVAKKLWCLALKVNSTAGLTGPTTAFFSVAPYIEATGEILKDKAENITIPDVFSECSKNMKLAIAVNAIFEAVQEICKEKYLFGLEPDPVAIAITSHPANVDIKEQVGQPAIFTVVATGFPLNYQWNKDGVELKEGGNVSGVTTQTLIISNVSESDVGNYTVTVSNVLGSVESKQAILTYTPPVVTTTTTSTSTTSTTTSQPIVEPITTTTTTTTTTTSSTTTTEPIIEPVYTTTTTTSTTTEEPILTTTTTSTTTLSPEEP